MKYFLWTKYNFPIKIPLTACFAGNVNFVPPPFCSLGEGWGEVLDVALELFELDLVDW